MHDIRYKNYLITVYLRNGLKMGSVTNWLSYKRKNSFLEKLLSLIT
jgi:sRNA-binding regulator protein Hfq